MSAAIGRDSSPSANYNLPCLVTKSSHELLSIARELLVDGRFTLVSFENLQQGRFAALSIAPESVTIQLLQDHVLVEKGVERALNNLNYEYVTNSGSGTNACVQTFRNALYGLQLKRDQRGKYLNEDKEVIYKLIKFYA